MQPIDILMVTFDHFDDFQAVVALIYRNTASPFRLLVADNGGNRQILDFLHRLAAEKGNVLILQNPENRYCCHASNQLLSLCESDYIFYICSYECFVLKRGWDLECIEEMDRRPEAGMGGYLSWSKYYVTGADYAKHEFISKFRHPEYASQHPEKKFFHVQGGFFILRKSMYEQIGGFNEKLAHGHMDVEYSYYAEAMGWQLLSLPKVLSIHRTTRPNLEAFDLHKYSVVHPLSVPLCRERLPEVDLTP